jgi:hypothetical protein
MKQLNDSIILSLQVKQIIIIVPTAFAPGVNDLMLFLLLA